MPEVWTLDCDKQRYGLNVLPKMQPKLCLSPHPSHGRRREVRLFEQADGKGKAGRHAYHKHLKKGKVRKERRKANKDPEAQPAYKKFKGYEL
jgi:hypothetical protein